MFKVSSTLPFLTEVSIALACNDLVATPFILSKKEKNNDKDDSIQNLWTPGNLEDPRDVLSRN